MCLTSSNTNMPDMLILARKVNSCVKERECVCWGNVIGSNKDDGCEDLWKHRQTRMGQPHTASHLRRICTTAQTAQQQLDEKFWLANSYIPNILSLCRKSFHLIICSLSPVSLCPPIAISSEAAQLRYRLSEMKPREEQQLSNLIQEKWKCCLKPFVASHANSFKCVKANKYCWYFCKRVAVSFY